MGCLSSKHGDLSEHTTAVLARYHLTEAHISKAYSLFVKIQTKHNRDKTPLQLKLAGNRPVIYYHDLRHTFAIPPSLLSAHLLDVVTCEHEGELSFPEFVELSTVVSLMSREQLVSFGYHAFAVNEADELHLSDFVAGLTELKDVYPRIINGADIPVTKLGLLAQTTIDTLHTPHSASATSAAANPPTPHHLTLSTFRQVMLNQPWFVDILSLIQEQFQRKTRSEREWNVHLQQLKTKDKAVLAAIDDIVKRRTAGTKKGMKTARGSESAGGKHVRRQSTVHARAMERIGRRQSSVLPEVGLQELRKEMAQLVEEEKGSLDETGSVQQHQQADESSTSARDGSSHRKSAMRRPSRHALPPKRKGSFSNQPDDAPLHDGSPSLSSRQTAHRRNHTVTEESSLSRGRAGSGTDVDSEKGGKGLRQSSQSHHSHRPARMRNGRVSVDIGVMDRVQTQRLHTLRRNSTGSSEEGHDTESGGRTTRQEQGKTSGRGTDDIKEAEEEDRTEQSPQYTAVQPSLPPRDSRSQLGRERVSINSTESGTFRSRTNSGLTRVNERVSREDNTTDDTMSPSGKSIPSSPPSRDRPVLPTTGSSPSLPRKTVSTSHSSHASVDAAESEVVQMRAREKSPTRSQPESPAAVPQPQQQHASSDEQDDQLTRLQAITAQKKLSVSTVHRKSSVARASADEASSSDGDGAELPPMPRRGSVMRDNPQPRVSPHGTERLIGEVSSNSASPSSVHRDVRRRNDSVSREDEAPTAQHIRGSVSREHHSPVHSEAYRKELLQDNHSKYGSSPNLRPDRTSTSTSYSHPQAALQHTRSVPPSSHHTASPHTPGSLRPSISGLSVSPYPHSRQASLSVAALQPMGAWDSAGGMAGMAGMAGMPVMGGEMVGGLYRPSFSGMQGGVVGGPPSMYGFAPARMSLSLSPQPMPRQLH